MAAVKVSHVVAVNCDRLWRGSDIFAGGEEKRCEVGAQLMDHVLENTVPQETPPPTPGSLARGATAIT